MKCNIFIIFLLAGCVTSKYDPSQAGGWSAQYSYNTVLKQSAGGFYFDFPTQDGVHYIVKTFKAEPQHPREIVATFKITGNATFQATRDTGAFPAHVRLYFKGGERWWSNPKAYVLQTSAKTVTLSVPVDPAEWTNVLGKRGSEIPQIFMEGWKRDGQIGMTFGASGFGHGAYVKSGSARFTLVSFEVK